MSMDDGYRKMETAMGQRTDKFEAGVKDWADAGQVIAKGPDKFWNGTDRWTEDDGWVTAYHTIGKSGLIMRTLYPNGIAPEQMDDALAVIRIIDKLFRIASQKDAFGESPWHDAAGYCVLALNRNQKSNPKKEEV